MLRELAHHIGERPLLIPTTDNSAMFVAAYGEALKRWYRFTQQPSGLVEALCSKQQMYHLAKAHGIPTDETRLPQARKEVGELDDMAELCVMLESSAAAVIFG